MAARAKVRSVEALEDFRAALIRYLEKAVVTVDEVTDEVRRTKDWLARDCPAHWRREAARRERVLKQREQELFTARLSGLQDDTSAQQLAVARARRALEEVEEKLRCARAWTRQYDGRVEPLARRVDKLRHTLSQDMRRAVAFLDGTIRSREAYAEVRPAGGATGERPATAREEAAEAPAESSAASESRREDA